MTLPREIDELIGRLWRIRSDISNEKRNLQIAEASAQDCRQHISRMEVEYLELKKELTIALQDEE